MMAHDFLFLNWFFTIVFRAKLNVGKKKKYEMHFCCSIVICCFYYYFVFLPDWELSLFLSLSLSLSLCMSVSVYRARVKENKTISIRLTVDQFLSLTIYVVHLSSIPLPPPNRKKANLQLFSAKLDTESIAYHTLMGRVFYRSKVDT